MDYGKHKLRLVLFVLVMSGEKEYFVLDNSVRRTL